MSNFRRAVFAVLGSTLAAWLTACASDGRPAPPTPAVSPNPSPSAPPIPAPPTPVPLSPSYFAKNPIDLMPEAQVAIAVNLDRVRTDPPLYRRLSKRLYETITENSGEIEAFRALLDRIQAIYVGLTDLEAEEPSLLMIVRGVENSQTLQEALLSSDDFQLEPNAHGFLRAELQDGDTFVLVDAHTALLYEPAYQSEIAPILAGRARTEFKRSSLYQTLSKSAGFGTAAASLLGTIRPETIEKFIADAPLAAGPLLNALRTVDSFGLRIQLERGVQVRLSAHTASPEEASKLVGMFDLLKQVALQSPRMQAWSPLLTQLRIDNRNDELRMQVTLPVEFLKELLDKKELFESRGQTTI